MAERGRPVLLEEEVSDPCEAVTAAERRQQPPGVARRDGCRQQCQHTATADEVQPPRGAVGVLGQVERIELAAAGKAAHAIPSGCRPAGQVRSAVLARSKYASCAY